MKKIITLILAVALALTAMVSCSINDTEVAVIWSEQSDDYIFTVADALDRAFYIENVKYKHYDAKGDSAEQLKLVDDAIKAGTPVLVVNPTNAATATAVVAKAKDADIPVIFVEADLLSLAAIKAANYAKAYTVNAGADSIVPVLSEKIAADLAENYTDYDRNGDGKITVASLGLLGAASIAEINKELAEIKSDKKPPKALKDIDNPEVVPMDIKYYGANNVETVNKMLADFAGVGSNEVKPTAAELIVLDDQAEVDDVLLAMREFELNHKKLVTHFIPLYTVGNTKNMGSLLGEKAKQEEKDAYSVLNVIDNGYLSGAVVQDDNGIATAVAEMVRAIIKGEDVLGGVEESYVKDGAVLVPYTVYG